MKRNIKGTLAIAFAMLLATSLNAKVLAKEVEVNISVNEKTINFTKETGIPFADERERTFVPIRVVMEAMDVLVDWNQERKEAILKTDDVEVIVTLDSDIIKVNDKEVKSDVPAIGFDGRTYLPIRIVAESFGAKVDWDQESMTVLISKEKEELEEIEEEVPEGIDEEEKETNAIIRGSNVNIRYSYSTDSQKESEQLNNGDKILVDKVRKVSGKVLWCEFDFNGNKRWVHSDYVEILNWDNIEIDEVSYSVPADGEILPPYEEGRLTRSKGWIINHDGRKETYYDLDMDIIYEALWEIVDENGNFKFPKEEYPAWIDEYGYKKFGSYVIVAANFDINPFGTLLNCSAGTAIVGDTGGFVNTNPTLIDIATNWSSGSMDPLH